MIIYTSKQVKNLVSLVIPFRDVHLVENFTEPQADLYSALVISTDHKTNYVFAHLKDRDFVVARISEFLARLPTSRK